MAGIIKQFSNWCYRVVNMRVIVGSIALFAIFIILVLPDMAGRLSDITGVSRSPDVSFVYSAADFYAMAEAYGVEGREYYISQRFTFDLVWPLIYMFFFLALLTLFYRQLPAASSLRQANLLPFAGVFFDLLENSGAAYLMYRYPVPIPYLAAMVPVFTFLKWLFIGLSSIAILAGPLILVSQQMKINRQI